MSFRPGAAAYAKGRLFTAMGRCFSGATLKSAARSAICFGLAAALPLASSGVASAAPKSGHGPHVSPSHQGGSSVGASRHDVAGTVASLKGDGFVLVTAKGAALTVDVSSSTTYREPGVRPGNKAKVMAGDKVRVVGAEAGPGTLDATLVLVPAVRAEGTVAGVGTGSFVLTMTATTVTVNVSSATIYREPTVRSPGFANLLAGEKVVVTGAQAGTGTMDAATVFVRLAVRVGRVASLTSNGFTLTTAKGVSITINVSSSTKFKGPKGTSPNVSVSDQARVIGTDGGANTVNAISVMVNAFAGHGAHR